VAIRSSAAASGKVASICVSGVAVAAYTVAAAGDDMVVVVLGLLMSYRRLQ
jgi:hypothetical protein